MLFSNLYDLWPLYLGAFHPPITSDSVQHPNLPELVNLTQLDSSTCTLSYTLWVSAAPNNFQFPKPRLIASRASAQ
jgi:hypothetical protein